jgi:hypothetical protein
MEACGSAHHWARKLGGFGHAVCSCRWNFDPLNMRPLVGREAADRIAQSIRRAWGEGRGLLDVERHASHTRERNSPSRG